MKIITKEGLFALHLLEYFQACIDEGDLIALRDMGIDREMQLIFTQGLDTPTLKTTNVVLLEAINLPSLSLLINKAANAKRHIALEDDLLRNGASRVLMSTLFGWPDNEFTERRSRIGLDPVVGRPPKVTEEELLQIEDSLMTARDTQNLTISDPDPYRAAQAYLSVARLTGYSLRKIHIEAQGDES